MVSNSKINNPHSALAVWGFVFIIVAKYYKFCY